MSPATAAAITTDDLTVLAQYAGTGDPRCFELLVHRYQSMVLATCQRVMGRGSEAEDATQETFLKLAQNAGRIRSNAAAWLHACALRTALDLLRRRETRDRAERGSVDADPASPSPSDVATWREIKPLLDDALSQLAEEDRDLLVSRFLVGRSEADLAREADVNPGTLNRRIDRALERLRLKLRGKGLALAGVGVLGAALGHGLAPPVQPALTAAIMQVGLTGIGTGAVASSVVSSKLALALTLGTLSLATIGGLTVFSRGLLPSTILTTTGVAAEPQGPPTKEIGGLVGTWTTIDGHPESIMVSDGRMLTMSMQHVRDKKTVEAVIKVRLESFTPNAKGGEFTCRVQEIRVDEPGPAGELIGKELKGQITGEDGRILLEIKAPPDPATGEVPPNHFFMRWSGHKAGKTVAAAADAIADAPVGRWDSSVGFSLTIDPQNITLSDGSFVGMRYRILSWEPGPEYAKVQTICARHYDGSRVGERTKLLVRREPNGAWTIAVYDGPDRAKLNQWPSGFSPKRGESIRVVHFKEPG
jgi:RNA polymerase sigma factor (sigma-70 family)